MTSTSSELAATLVRYKDEEIHEALALVLSVRPDLQALIIELGNQEPLARYVGVISCFYPNKQYGFIQCEELKAISGLDTFLSEKELGPFNVGDTITFSAVTNKDGKPQARLLDVAPPDVSLEITPAADVNPAIGQRRPRPSEAGESEARASKVARTVPPSAVPKPGMVTEDMSALDWRTWNGDERHIGNISAFYPQKKYGFIKSDTLFQLYGVDTWISEVELAGFNVGDTVSFNVVLNKNGCPQARNLIAPPGESKPGGGWPTKTPRGLPTPTPRVLITPAPRVVVTPKPVQETTPVKSEDGSQRYVGTIASFIAERRYGFLKSDAARQYFGMDTFLSDKEIGSFSNGDVVSFSVRFNSSGKPQAYELQPGDAEDATSNPF